MRLIHLFSSRSPLFGRGRLGRLASRLFISRPRLLLTVALVLILLMQIAGGVSAMPDGPGQVDPPTVEVVPAAPANCQIVGILRQPMPYLATNAAMYYVICFSMGGPQ